MEKLQMEDIEIDECGTGRKRENILIRIGRKKYKCIMLFLCLIALLLQTAYLIVEKTDSANINKIIDQLPNITRRFNKLIKNFDQKLLDLSAQEVVKATTTAMTSSTPDGFREY